MNEKQTHSYLDVYGEDEDVNYCDDESEEGEVLSEENEDVNYCDDENEDGEVLSEEKDAGEVDEESF